MQITEKKYTHPIEVEIKKLKKNKNNLLSVSPREKIEEKQKREFFVFY